MRSAVDPELSAQVVAATVYLLMDGFTVFDDLSLDDRVFLPCTGVDHGFVLEFATELDRLKNRVQRTLGVLVAVRVGQLEHVIIAPSIKGSRLSDSQRVVVAANDFDNLFRYVDGHWD